MLWHTIFAHSCLLVAGVSCAAIQQQPLQAEISDALTRLKQKVGDRLIDVKPMAEPCYGDGAWDSPRCKEVRKWKGNDYWTSHQPGGYYYSNWASCQATDKICSIPVDNNTVIPGNATCHQGSVPPKMINITDASTLHADIRAAFEYVSAAKVPLVIKNTGHDWKGRSTAPRSLGLWTHKLQYPLAPIEYEKDFLPFNCSDRSRKRVFHYGPGQTWGEAYKFAENLNLSVLGGTCPTVGIAGWFQGGGHSPVSPLYGLGIDNLVQLEIMIPSSDEPLIVNECTNSELWFAIRGGGAGSFGVVTKITYRALDREPVADLQYSFDKLSDDDMEEYFDVLASSAVTWSEKGWGGYIKSTETGKQVVELAKANSTGRNAEADPSMKKLFEFFIQHNINYTIKDRHSWPEYVKQVETNHPADWSMNVATRLVPASLLSGSPKDEFVKALMEAYKAQLNFWLMLVVPTTYKGRVVEAAVHPTWRTATMLVRVMDKWDQFKDTENFPAARKHFEKVREYMDPIRDMTPGMGTSISESDIWEQNHNESFWGGANYARLLKVKHDVDPDNLLSNWHAVNWKETDIRYECYPRP